MSVSVKSAERHRYLSTPFAMPAHPEVLHVSEPVRAVHVGVPVESNATVDTSVPAHKGI